MRCNKYMCAHAPKFVTKTHQGHKALHHVHRLLDVINVCILLLLVKIRCYLLNTVVLLRLTLPSFITLLCMLRVARLPTALWAICVTFPG